ncbi:Hypothetical predicted protein [Olea europaea subsp. europaea]|uniref:Uncharacterized protein n=1 Tax=Olea europaea subsp. europaea TaxID=158383 RepID=A0A8S0P6F2_OLEEU|nr:Hypothetical predicted protein [Olea europaea subsp. europaea]
MCPINLSRLFSLIFTMDILGYMILEYSKSLLVSTKCEGCLLLLLLLLPPPPPPCCCCYFYFYFSIYFILFYLFIYLFFASMFTIFNQPSFFITWRLNLIAYSIMDPIVPLLYSVYFTEIMRN